MDDSHERVKKVLGATPEEVVYRVLICTDTPPPAARVLLGRRLRPFVYFVVTSPLNALQFAIHHPHSMVPHSQKRPSEYNERVGFFGFFVFSAKFECPSLPPLSNELISGPILRGRNSRMKSCRNRRQRRTKKPSFPADPPSRCPARVIPCADSNSGNFTPATGLTISNSSNLSAAEAWAAFSRRGICDWTGSLP